MNNNNHANTVRRLKSLLEPVSVSFDRVLLWMAHPGLVEFGLELVHVLSLHNCCRKVVPFCCCSEVEGVALNPSYAIIWSIPRQLIWVGVIPVVPDVPPEIGWKVCLVVTIEMLPHLNHVPTFPSIS